MRFNHVKSICNGCGDHQDLRAFCSYGVRDDRTSNIEEARERARNLGLKLDPIRYECTTSCAALVPDNISRFFSIIVVVRYLRYFNDNISPKTECRKLLTAMA